MNKPVHQNLAPNLIALIWGLVHASSFARRHRGLALDLFSSFFAVATYFTNPNTPYLLCCLQLAQGEPLAQLFTACLG